MTDESTGGTGIPRPEQAGDPPEVITTPEGFKIHGRNETSLIRSLTSFNGTPVSELEDRMKPSSYSQAGFLGEDESLIDVLAEDNDTVLEMGLTHQQLADFLHKFDGAPNSMSGVLGITFNDIRFGHFASQTQSPQDSPFHDGTESRTDHTIINLETGAMLNYSGLLPQMIHRYGFYEGKGTHYRIDPKKIAEVGGFIAKDSDDPIVQLINDKEAQVTITTEEQLTRALGLKMANIDVLSGQNYRIVPENFSMLLQALKESARPYYERDKPELDEDRIRRERVLASIETPQLTPQPYQQRYFDHMILTEIIPTDLPQYKDFVLQGIEELSLPAAPNDREPVTETQDFLEHTLTRIAENPDGQDNPHKAYYEELLKRLTKNPEAIATLIKAVVKFEGQPELITALDGVLPDFKSDVTALYRQQGRQISDDLSLNQLIQEQIKINEHEKMVQQIEKIAHDSGNVEVVETEDIERFIGLVDALKTEPDHHFTDDEEEVLRRLKIDPVLIPYALKVTSRLPYEWGASTFMYDLYNGNAGIERQLEQVLTSLPDGVDSQAREAIEAIFIQQEDSYARNIDLDEFARKIKLHTEAQGDAQEQSAPVTQNDVLNDYLGLVVPQFTDLLSQSFITKSLGTTQGRQRVEVRLDPAALEALPEVEIEGAYGSTTTYRKLTIGDGTYFIGDGKIVKGEPKHGAQILSLYTGNIIGLSSDIMY